MQYNVNTPRAMHGEFRWKVYCFRPRVGPRFIAWMVEEVAVVGAINYDEMQWRLQFWPVCYPAVGVFGLR